jgi:hypothetical protein
MISIVLGDSTLESLTSSVNASLLMLLLGQDEIVGMEVLFSNHFVVIVCYY